MNMESNLPYKTTDFCCLGKIQTHTVVVLWNLSGKSDQEYTQVHLDFSLSVQEDSNIQDHTGQWVLYFHFLHSKNHWCSQHSPQPFHS